MIWPFNRKISLEKSKLLEGFCDWHSHLLPGVDDGVKILSDTLQMLGTYERLGLKSLWLTPHIMNEMPNEPAQLKAKFEELKKAYQGTIHLELAAEYMLDNRFEQHLESGELLGIGAERKLLLVETSYYNPPLALRETLERIKAKGYTPLLAHPERYRYMDQRYYQELRELGIEFQLNLPSLIGAYGKAVRSKARELLGKGMYSYSGMDLHSPRVMKLILKGKLRRSELKLLRKLSLDKSESYDPLAKAI